MGISAGIEKFYTFAQFFSVMFLSVGIFGVTLTAVYVISRAPAGSAARRIISPALLFLLFLLTELSLDVAPTHAAVRIRLALNCVALFLLCRALFVFCLRQFNAGRGVSLAFFAAVVEAVILVVLGVTRPVGLAFFSEATLDRVLPGTLFFVLVALSAGWMAGGVLILSVGGRAADREPPVRPGPRARCARRSFAAGVGLLSVVYVLHHVLPGNHAFPIFAAGVLPAVALFALSLVRLNLLDVLLHPLQAVTGRVDMLAVVLGEDGRIVSANSSRYANVIVPGGGTAADLFGRLVRGIDDEAQREQLNVAAGLGEASTGRFRYRDDGEPCWLEYRTAPVTYMRRRVGWLLTLLDVTEEENGVQALRSRELELERGYEELQVYSRTTLYHDAAWEREELARKLNAVVNHGLAQVVADLGELAEDPGSDDLLEAGIGSARESLSEVRQVVRILRQPVEGEVS